MAEESPGESFGAYLRALREEHARLTMGAVLLRLGRLGIKSDRSTISRYESDQRQTLDARVLWGLAQVYAEPVERLFGTLAKLTRAKVGELPASRLTDEYTREQRMLRLFRSASSDVQDEVTELLEFKVRRTRKDPRPQPRAAGGERRRSKAKSPVDR